MHVVKDQVLLQFPDVLMLWKFAQTMQSRQLEINTQNKTLICYCADADIERAIREFKAVVVKEGTSLLQYTQASTQ